MFICVLLVFTSCVLNAYAYYIAEHGHNITEINSFAFGSCYNGLNNQSRYEIFDVIGGHSPDFFLWLGDAAYVRIAKYRSTYQKLRDIFTFRTEEFNETHVISRFNDTKNNPYYAKFDKKYPVIGVWDDNDYGQNDGNGYFKYKDQIKRLFLNFLDEPMSSQRRAPGRAIYGTYVFGDPRTYKTVRMILLDVRYNKSGILDTNRDMLGEEQWQWLEKTLSEAEETFIFIASGTQILPIDRLLTEAWFPESRTRLFNLLGTLKKSGVVLLTGDIHNGQILKTPCILPEIGYHLIEVTSSGLGHYCTKKCDVAIDYILPSMYKFTRTIADYNFAHIEFQWGDSKQNSRMDVSLIDMKNIIRTKIEIKYADLIYNPSYPKDPSCLLKISSRFKGLSECVSYYWNFYQNRREILVQVSCGVIGLTYLTAGYYIFSAVYKRVLPIIKRKLFAS